MKYLLFLERTFGDVPIIIRNGWLKIEHEIKYWIHFFVLEGLGWSYPTNWKTQRSAGTKEQPDLFFVILNHQVQIPSLCFLSINNKLYLDNGFSTVHQNMYLANYGAVATLWDVSCVHCILVTVYTKCMSQTALVSLPEDIWESRTKEAMHWV